MKKTVYEDTAELHCTDNGKTVIAEVLDHRPEKMLSVSIDRSVRVNLKFHETKKIYIGSMGGLEFTTHGPQQYNYYEGRKK